MDYLSQEMNHKKDAYDGDFKAPKLRGLPQQKYLHVYENQAYPAVYAPAYENQVNSAVSMEIGIQPPAPFMKSTEGQMPPDKRERKCNRGLIIIISVVVVLLLGIFIVVHLLTKAPSREVSRGEDLKVQCPNEFMIYQSEKCGRFCYRYESNHCQSWFGARQTCQNEGGDLMLPSECTYPFFREQASLNKGSCSHIWIGGRTNTPGSNYVTVKGDVIPRTFSYWSSGQPDGLGGESCLEMRSYFTNYLMNDYHCEVEEGFICQIFS